MNLYTITSFLVILGAINWGLVGAFRLNLVELLAPGQLPRIIYGIIGIAGFFQLMNLMRIF